MRTLSISPERTRETVTEGGFGSGPMLKYVFVASAQPAMTFDLCLSETAGSRSLHRLGQFELDWSPQSQASQATSIQHQ
jgi:hypothetical protein